MNGAIMVSRSLLGHTIGLAMLAGAMSSGAEARTAYDGSWSVLVITQSGICDRAYRYSIRVNNGVLRYSGDAAINLSGQISSNGRVHVTIGRGKQGAVGSGRLSRNRGVGSWRGRSGQQQCRGRWEAERR